METMTCTQYKALQRPWLRPVIAVAFAVVAFLPAGLTQAHSPTVDSSLKDWCVGATSNTFGNTPGRTEDSAAALVCGNCQTTPGVACVVNSDCTSGPCINPGTKTELAWWDERKDGAVNDLATIATTQDATNLYFAAELWVDPDPVSLPFAEIAIDVIPGGSNSWFDPGGQLRKPGTCSVFTDRGCTSNADCRFCNLSTEPLGDRVRTCGSGCDPDIGDVCNMSQTCQGIGVLGTVPGVGGDSSPAAGADYLLVFDFSRWLLGASGPTRVMRNDGGTWTPIGAFEPAVNPGASGGSGGPPGSVEVAIPWSVFAGGFIPGQPFKYTMVISRGSLSLDYTPDGAIEDVMSEKVAGTTSASQDSCFGVGLATTLCEIGDGNTDAFIPRPAATVGGRLSCLTLDKGAGSSITLDWCASCSPLDDDYEVYEGTIGNWYSHVQVPGRCTTGGLTTTTFNASAGSHYYLVVPAAVGSEGSYGVDSGGNERPDAAAPCKVQVLGNCP